MSFIFIILHLFCGHIAIFFLFSTSTNRLFFLWYGEGCKGGLQIWGDGGYQRSWAAWCEIHREQKRSLKKLKWAQWGWRNECLAWKCSAVDSAFVAWAGFGWGSGVVRMLSVLVLPGKLLPSHLCLYLHLQQLKLPPTTAAASGHLPLCSSSSKCSGVIQALKSPGLQSGHAHSVVKPVGAQDLWCQSGCGGHFDAPVGCLSSPSFWTSHVPPGPVRYLVVTLLCDGELVFFSESHDKKRLRVNYLIISIWDLRRRNVAWRNRKFRENSFQF